jgi:hypothetical protein
VVRYFFDVLPPLDFPPLAALPPLAPVFPPPLDDLPPDVDALAILALPM